jgi:hypothetical protein
MKAVALILFIFSIVGGSCIKSSVRRECLPATIIDRACYPFGIKINNKEYGVYTLPAEFQQIGMEVCIEYDINPDPSARACMDPEYVEITHIEKD